MVPDPEKTTVAEHIPDIIRKITSALLVPMILFLSTDVIRGAEVSESARRLIDQCMSAVDLRQYDTMVEKGTRLMRLGRSEGNESEELTGESFILRGAVQRRDTSDFGPRVVKLETRLPALAEQSEWESAGYVAKSLSLYYHLVGSDFSQASSYAFKALDYFRKSGHVEGKIEALSGLASIYFNKNDASGFNYALDSYRMARELGDERQLYVPVSNMANYLFNQGKLDDALKYLKEADGIAGQLHLDTERSYIDSFFGDIYAAMSKNDEAEIYYLRSIDYKPATSKYDRIYARICYSIFLMRENRMDEALAQLNEAERMSESYKVESFRIQINNLLSTIFEQKKDYRNALEYYRKGSELRDLIFSKEKEREFALLDLRYKVSEEKRKNAEQGIELMNKNRTLVVSFFIGGILLLLFAWRLFYYRRQMSTYREIVGRHLDSVETERRLRKQLEKALADRKETAVQRQGGLSDDRKKEMFHSLEKLMTEDKIYRQADLSLDKAASLLQTNRTYLSQIVNEETEHSFSTYVNSYRLHEAIELLSDPDNDEPLKNIGLTVGFSTPSNFYSLFRQKVGVSPSVFRSNVRNIKSDNKNSQFDN